MKKLLKRRTQKMVKNYLKYILLAIFTIQISSCTHTHLVSRQTPDLWAQQVNSNSGNNPGIIRFKEAMILKAENIRISGEMVNWTDQQSQQKMSATIHELQKITLATEGEDALKKRGMIHYKKGMVSIVENIHIAGDSASWTDRETQKKVTTNLNELKEITLIKKGKGAGEGFLAGLTGGFVSGFLIGLASGDDQRSETGWNIALSAEENGLLAGILLGGVGGLLGLASGASSGSKDKYILIDEPSDKPRVISSGKTIRSPVSVRRKF